MSTPTDATPSVRCWKDTELLGTISSVIRENREHLRSTFPSAKEVLVHLGRIGWTHPIEVDVPTKGRPVKFYLVDMEAGPKERVHPLELLQAYLPGGVVCYFSALSHHGLTTQIPAQHHIARIIPPKDMEQASTSPTSEQAEGTGDTPGRNPLGTEIFRFEDVTFYITKRDASLVPGVQVRVLSPRSRVRITTFEQTLLDTLLQPVRCGGVSIAMEAWEKGIEQLDADQMANHLKKIGREGLGRRVGAMVDVLATDVGGTSLGAALKEIKGRVAQSGAEMEEIPLLPGFDFCRSNNSWKVRIP